MLRILLLASLVACSLGAATRRRPRLDGRIVGGEEVDIKDFPYQVSYEYIGSHMCGASIISPDWVVTAGHCTDGTSVASSRFRAGSSTLEDGGTLHPATEIIQHPQYDYWTIDFDISVVKVSEPFVFGTGVDAIALTSAEPDADVTATVSGWGSTFPGGPLSSQLRAVDVLITDRKVCNDTYVDYEGITENMICAGVPGGGKDACGGDSGGPLTVNGELVGIVSWGLSCALADYPGVYSNVASLRSFVTENTDVQ